MRVLFGVFLVILAVGDAIAQQPPGSAPAPPSRPTTATKPLQFDVEGFMKDFDKNKDGSLQREELPNEYRGAFERIDTNKDGKISREELTSGFAFLQPRRRASDFVYVLVEMSDIDKDCELELQRAYDILRSLDKNRDGKIDAGELTAARDGIVKNRVDTIFTWLDANKDGKISRDEAKGRIRENFDEIDRNRDGFIEREELTHAIVEKPTITTPAGERRTPPARPVDR